MFEKSLPTRCKFFWIPMTAEYWCAVSAMLFELVITYIQYDLVEKLHSVTPEHYWNKTPVYFSTQCFDIYGVCIVTIMVLCVEV